MQINKLTNTNTSEESNTPPSAPLRSSEGAKRVGNYVLGKKIGEGKFGRVHLGLHLPTQERVAVKIFEKAKIIKRDVSQVKSQIKILSSCRHTSLLHLFEVLETEKSLLLVTEYITGGELFHRICTEKFFTEHKARSIFAEIIAGVHYLHENGVVHRDLKPQNILLTKEDRVKIIDLGLSRCYVRGEKLKEFCGSPCYAAPEMVQGKAAYEPQAIDVWSCGVILYAMVCGSLPFCDKDPKALFRKIVGGVYKLPPCLSPALTHLLRSMLCVDAGARITIRQIIIHQWMRTDGNQINGQLEMQSEIKHYKINGIGWDEVMLPEKRVLQECGHLASLKRDIEQNVKNKDTATYELTMRKLHRAGHLIQSYLCSAAFNRSKYVKRKFLIVQCPSIQDNLTVPECYLKVQAGTEFRQQWGDVSEEIQPMDSTWSQLGIQMQIIVHSILENCFSFQNLVEGRKQQKVQSEAVINGMPDYYRQINDVVAFFHDQLEEKSKNKMMLSFNKCKAKAKSNKGIYFSLSKKNYQRNINSKKKRILFEDLKLPLISKNKTVHSSTEVGEEKEVSVNKLRRQGQKLTMNEKRVEILKKLYKPYSYSKRAILTAIRK